MVAALDALVEQPYSKLETWSKPVSDKCIALVGWAQQKLKRLYCRRCTQKNESGVKRAESLVRAGLVIAGGHYQVLTQVPVVFDVPFPPIVREVLSWFDFINLPVVEMLRPECWSPEGGGDGGITSQSSVWQLLLPVMLPCLWALMVVIMLWHIRAERRRKPTDGRLGYDSNLTWCGRAYQRSRACRSLHAVAVSKDAKRVAPACGETHGCRAAGGGILHTFGDGDREARA